MSYLLARASYPDELRQEYLAFFNDKLAPLFGPSPAEFSGSTPSSFISDDHTPFEFIWAIGRKGNMSVRFAFEPLSPFNGSSLPPRKSMPSLDILRGMPSLDLTWSNICRRTLLFDPPCPNENRVHFQHSSQFFLGRNTELLQPIVTTQLLNRWRLRDACQHYCWQGLFSAPRSSRPGRCFGLQSRQ